MNNKSTITFGIHLMIDGYEASSELLKDKDLLTSLLLEVPKKLGMHTISEPQVVEVGPLNKKDPGGVSGFVLIAESHISFHTFPKRGFITIDIYTCQENLDTDLLVKEFTQALEIKRSEVYIQKRGVSYPEENIYEE